VIDKCCSDQLGGHGEQNGIADAEARCKKGNAQDIKSDNESPSILSWRNTCEGMGARDACVHEQREYQGGD
jgi:hypothetical protein